MIACIICGGYLEAMLAVIGLSFICRLWKKWHNRGKCECCKGKERKQS